MLIALRLCLYWCMLYVVVTVAVFVVSYFCIYFKFAVRYKHYRRYLYDRIKHDIKELFHLVCLTIRRLLPVNLDFIANTAMASKKRRDLEIVCNLQWRTKPNGGANIIGVYDVPQTTLNWSTFKLYLLKNSGTTGDDVRVSYMSEEGEVPVNSQRDFQIALYTFRKKARNSEVITLWLDRISEVKKDVADAQTDAMESSVKEQAVAAAAANSMMETGPPEWFKKYMKQFKKELLDDVKGLVAPLQTNNDESASGYCRPCLTAPATVRHEGKSKHESKRSKQCARATERELSKIARFKHIDLDKKMEKIERKSMKLKEKSLGLFALAAATRSTDNNNAGRSSGSNRISIQLEDLELHYYDAKPVKSQLEIVPHMTGNEVYLQDWEVINTGDLAWDSNTTFRHAWGHENLEPISKCVQVPALKPGERGLVSVALGVPSAPGKYESYWHFYHKERRFGRWLGCQIIVDPYPVPNNNTADDALLQTSTQFATSSPLPNPFEDHFAPESPRSSPKLLNTDALTEDLQHLSIENDADKNGILEETKTATVDNCSSDSDNQSIVSLADSNTSDSTGTSEDFVVLSSAEKDESTEEAKFEEFTQNEVSNVKVEEIVVIQAEDVQVGEIAQNEVAEAKVEEIAQNEVEKKEETADQEAVAAAVVATENDANNNNNSEADVLDDSIKELAKEVKEEARKSGYAYMTIDGKKLSVPKCFLHDEFLATAEDAPDPTEPPKTEQPETKSTGAIPKTTGTPLKFHVASVSEASTYCKATSETVPTFSEDFCKLAQSSTAAAAATAKLLHDSYCSAAGSNFSDHLPVKSTENDTESVATTCKHTQASEKLNNSHCSSMGNSLSSSMRLSSMNLSTDSSRMFVFPATVPGFEILSTVGSTTNTNTANTSRTGVECSQSPFRKAGGDGNETDPRNYYPFFPASGPALNPQIYNYVPGVAPDVININAAPTSNSVYGDVSCAYSPAYYDPILFGALPYEAPPPVVDHAYLYAHFPPQTEIHQPITATAPMFLPPPIQPPQPPIQPPIQRPSTTANRPIQPPRFPNYYRQNTSTAPKLDEKAIPLLQKQQQQQQQQQQQEQPLNLMTSAVNAASSAMNTAKSVFQMVTPSNKADEPGRWVNGHWVTTKPESARDTALRRLREMGFENRDYNATLLNRYEDDMEKVITELLNNK